MGVFVNTSDFAVGEWTIAVSVKSQKDLDAFIDKYEPAIIDSLLGSTLGNLFLANTPPVGTNLILGPLSVDDCDGQVSSFGISEMIKGFVYFKFLSKQMSRNEVGATVKIKSENAVNLGNDATDLARAWNQSAEAYRAIQRFIVDDRKVNSVPWVDYDGKKGDWDQYIIGI